MPQKVFILVLIFSIGFFAWTIASPPSGTIGTSVRSLFTDASGNVGIKTASPATLLDINGTTTIRNGLDMQNNRIIGVATPTTGLDAINKSYADTVLGSMNTNMKPWGEGRPGATVMNSAGECVNGSIKVSRSSRLATWDGARAACPANWWVCSAAERGTAACPAPSGTSKNVILCNVTASPQGDSVEDLILLLNNGAWITETASSTLYFGKLAGGGSGATKSDQYTCTLLPVWCCSQ